jgi:hypothetical protein
VSVSDPLIDASHCKAEIHAVLAKCGVQVSMTDLFGVVGTGLLDGLDLPAPYAARIGSAAIGPCGRDDWLVGRAVALLHASGHCRRQH